MPHSTKEKRREYLRKKRLTGAYKAMQKKSSHKWYLKNKETSKENSKSWHKRNLERSRKYKADWARKNREKKGRAWELKSDFGITLDDYNKLFIKQNGNCAICGINQSQLKSKLAVDHCHKTGRIRGLLCFNCNTNLGKWNDDIVILKRALNYLSKDE